MANIFQAVVPARRRRGSRSKASGKSGQSANTGRSGASKTTGRTD